MLLIRFATLRTFFLLAITILVLEKPSLVQAASLPDSVTLTTHNLPPYGSYQTDGSFSGVAHDVVSCALSRLNITLDLKVLPWRRAQLEVKEGNAHGFYAGSQNQKRDEYAVRSAEIAGQTWQWYLHEDSTWNTQDNDFKKNASVSSFLGANMQKWLVENNYKVKATPIDTEKLLELLMLGRIDAALANNYVMNNLLETRGIADKFRVEVLKDKPLYVYFKKAFISQYPNFLELFNESVLECKE